jgi:S-adenosylmethionine decarboxylase
MPTKMQAFALVHEIRSHHLAATLIVSETTLKMNGRALSSALRRAVKLSKLQTVRSTQVDFEPHGASAVALLKESHVAIHLWPEFKVITVDIHVCDFKDDNLAKAWKLAQELTDLALSPFKQEDWVYTKS